MPVKFIPYTPNTVEGQAVLDNITRTRRILSYRENGEVYNRIKRGMPYYEVETIEQVGEASDNLILRGECISACAYLKEQGVKVDLVYIDPPFASGADYAKKIYVRRNPKLAQKIKQAEQEMENQDLQAFEETMYGDIWKKEDYLNWMYENLQAIKSVMSETGSIYVHLDWHVGHYVKVLLDEVFGESGFLNQVIWKRTPFAGSSKSRSTKFPVNHDMLFLYVKNCDIYNFKNQYVDYSDDYIARFKYKDKIGNYRKTLLKTYSDKTEKWLKDNDRWIEPIKAGAHPSYKQYLHESKGKQVEDIWDIEGENVWEDVNAANPMANERVEYATQKPEALLERIIKASSNEGMVVADFFGGSGVTAKVANDLKRNFIHVDVGINSIQTTRDRLIANNASFVIKEVKDGVALFRNPQQTMDKLAGLISGLQKNAEGVSKFWFGVINDSKDGAIPVFVPDLIDSKQNVLDIPLINRIINQEIAELGITAKKVVVYYIDIDDEPELKKFIKDNNQTTLEIELRDLKNLLHETVVNDELEVSCQEISVDNADQDLFDQDDVKDMYEVEVIRFVSDRLNQKIGAFNEKGYVQSVKTGKAFKPIEISEEGLELIELISLDYFSSEGEWHSSVELKIDKLGYVSYNGKKTKNFWDGKIQSIKKPLRIKIRNICGDESIEKIIYK